MNVGVFDVFVDCRDDDFVVVCDVVEFDFFCVDDEFVDYCWVFGGDYCGVFEY